MKILGAYRPDGAVFSARLLDNAETPGLGKKAESPVYMNKFKGTGAGDDKPVPTSKEMLKTDQGAAKQEMKQALTFRTWFLGGDAGGGTDAISGATITFLGVSKALAEGSRYVRTELGGR